MIGRLCDVQTVPSQTSATPLTESLDPVAAQAVREVHETALRPLPAGIGALL